MPYIYCDTYSVLVNRKEEYNRINSTAKYCCNGPYETGVPNQFGVQFPLSLDEYCTPALDTTILESRNKDQVLVRYQLGSDQEPQDRKIPPDTKVITVHQAWLWRIDNQVITAYPQQVRNDLLPLEYDMDMDISEVFQGRDFEGIAYFISLLVDAMERPFKGTETILDVFEKSIIKISQDVKRYLTSSEIDNMSIDEERRYFHEIGDIREELSMIKSVLFQQEKVWKDLTFKVWPEYWRNGNFVIPIQSNFSDVSGYKLDLLVGIWRTIGKPQSQFEKFKKEIERLEQNADRVASSVTVNLDLKQKHASFKEAHSTAIMSAAVFGFTLITIIFAPLSFVLALFALPIDRFQDRQEASRWTDQAGMYSTNYIGKWIGEYLWSTALHKY